MKTQTKTIALTVVAACAAACLYGAAKKPAVKQPWQIKNEKLAELRTGAAAAVATNDFDRGVSLIQEALVLDDGKRLRTREAMTLADALAKAGEMDRAVRLCEYMAARPNIMGIMKKELVFMARRTSRFI